MTKHSSSPSRLLGRGAARSPNDYGVWVEKSMYGRKLHGHRADTFVIDGKGVIRNIWHKVKVPGHVEEVLQAAEALK